ncbi:Membrane transporter [Gryllus bimaculatus]|nr:Membrane transporter [Gryllus bimaculatus]
MFCENPLLQDVTVNGIITDTDTETDLAAATFTPSPVIIGAIVAVAVICRIGARTIMTALVVWALVLQGLIQHSPSVALLTLAEPALSSEEFAEYVANTSYVTRYCRPGNVSDAAADDGEGASASVPAAATVATPPDAAGGLEEVSYEGSATTPPANDSDLLLAYDEALPLNVTRTPRHRHGLGEPFLKLANFATMWERPRQDSMEPDVTVVWGPDGATFRLLVSTALIMEQKKAMLYHTYC